MLQKVNDSSVFAAFIFGEFWIKCVVAKDVLNIINERVEEFLNLCELIG